MKNPAEQSYYEILELPPDATQEEIDRAFDRALVLYGPNAIAAYTLVDPAEAKRFLEIVEEAYLTLSDPELRASYDEKRALASAPEPAAPPPPEAARGATQLAFTDILRKTEAETAPQPPPPDAAPATAAASEPEPEPAATEAQPSEPARESQPEPLHVEPLEPTQRPAQPSPQPVVEEPRAAVAEFLASPESAPSEAPARAEPAAPEAERQPAPDDERFPPPGPARERNEAAVLVSLPNPCETPTETASAAAFVNAPAAERAAAPEPEKPAPVAEITPAPLEAPKAAPRPEPEPAREHGFLLAPESEPAPRAVPQRTSASTALARAGRRGSSWATEAPPRPAEPERAAAPPAGRMPEIAPNAPFNGELLRRVREARSMTLRELSDRTRISASHLENLEADRYDLLPATVYLRGFLMLVARELKLDPLRVSKSYLELVTRGRGTP